MIRMSLLSQQERGIDLGLGQDDPAKSAGEGGWKKNRGSWSFEEGGRLGSGGRKAGVRIRVGVRVRVMKL